MFKRALIVFCSLLWTACTTAPPQGSSRGKP